MVINMTAGRKKVLAVALVVAVVAAGIVIFNISHKEVPLPKASVDEILNVRSERSSLAPDYIVASGDSRFYTLIATPCAVYYGPDGEKTAVPLLVGAPNPALPGDDVSKSQTAFLSAYGGNGTVIGPVDHGTLSQMGVHAGVSIGGSPRDASLNVARQFWVRSDAAMLVKNDHKGYAAAVNAVPLASYLNIPVIVTDRMTSDVVSTLKALNVKYTLLCGDIKGYGKVMDLSNHSYARSIIGTGVYTDGKSALSTRLGINSTYLAVADPMDTELPVVVKSFTKTFSGTVKSEDTGSTSFPAQDPDAPRHYITIPDDYEFANVKLDTEMEFTQPIIPGHTPDDDGERCYTYFGVDEDEDGVMINDPDSENDCQEFFVPSLAYETIRDGNGVAIKAHGYSEKPIFHSTGKHMISILATLDVEPRDVNPTQIKLLPPPETTYKITVTVEKLDRPNYPLLKNASSLAPYIAAFRSGIVLAEDSFSTYTDELLKHDKCGDPSQNPDLVDVNNRHVMEIKAKINSVLADMTGTKRGDDKALADALSSGNTVHLAIVGDTNMIPWYIYPSTGEMDEPQQGWGVGSDAAYSDVDMPMIKAPTDIYNAVYDVAVGRMMGWDIQDLCALMARTFFYDNIVSAFKGHGADWKDSAMTTFGSKPPVGTAKTVTEKVDAAFSQAGFNVDSSHDNIMSNRKYSGPYWEESNFIYFCAHGFFYWFVPPGIRPDGVGGGFDVAHVQDMDFGPSVVFASSCVTGKVDGIQPYNSIALTMLHSGMNAYIGASRLSWGTLSINPASDSNEAYGAYLGLLMYGYLTGYLYDKHGGLMSQGDGDHTIGEALMLAKTKYYAEEGSDQGGANDDTIEEFNLFADPAFNPYEPNYG